MYYLMHLNEPIASIYLTEDGIHLQEMINPYSLPIGLRNQPYDEQFDTDLTHWNNNRCIPLGRPNYELLMQALQIEQWSDLIPKSYMCSLTDCYWFTPDLNIRWEDVNFHQNGFDSNLYKTLFYGEDGNVIDNMNSPDITTQGVLPKMWTQSNGKMFLYKASSDALNTETYTEAVIAMIAHKMDIPCVHYGITMCKDKLVCVSECFVQSPNKDFVTAEQLQKDYPAIKNDMCSYLKSIGFEREMQNMLTLDYMVGNLDRHTKNYGIVVNNDDNTIEFAPLFDHGNSDLLNDVSELYYQIDKLRFKDILKVLDDEHLKKICNFPINYAQELIAHAHCWNDREKRDIIDNITNRIEAARTIIQNRSGYDDREH